MEVINVYREMMSSQKLIVIRAKRIEYGKDFTISEVKINGEFFSHCLEDSVRPVGVKVPKDTAIPEGLYKVDITYSNRFERNMMLLYNAVLENGLRVCTDGFIHFSGIRPHGGNDIDDTEGCPLLAYKKGDVGKIYQRSDLDLCNMVQAWMKQGYQVFWDVRNITQKS